MEDLPRELCTTELQHEQVGGSVPRASGETLPVRGGCLMGRPEGCKGITEAVLGVASVVRTRSIGGCLSGAAR